MPSHGEGGGNKISRSTIISPKFSSFVLFHLNVTELFVFTAVVAWSKPVIVTYCIVINQPYWWKYVAICTCTLQNLPPRKEWMGENLPLWSPATWHVCRSAQPYKLFSHELLNAHQFFDCQIELSCKFYENFEDSAHHYEIWTYRT